ncbi:hypothetical protein B0H17DRAFT_1136518 [Mycena rosella]|uniref:Uncharacterized protein n=1 Tax=Mycena rosella TaxID=1033263 RepID=A0AAD7GGI3_MYCRO|nr:hypothetical protein B0H17DRAFT_1136518 [Mycena rosella]
MTRHEFSDAALGQLVAKLVHKAHSSASRNEQTADGRQYRLAPSHLASNLHRSEHHPPGHLGERPRLMTLFKIELAPTDTAGCRMISGSACRHWGPGCEVTAVVAASGGPPGNCDGALSFLGTSASEQMAKHRGPAPPMSKRRELRLQKFRVSAIIFPRHISSYQNRPGARGSRGIQIEKYPEYPHVRDSPPREAL